MPVCVMLMSMVAEMCKLVDLTLQQNLSLSDSFQKGGAIC